VHGAAHRVVPIDVASTWARALLAIDPKVHDGALFALTLLARRTGDRARDLDDGLRAQVLAALAQAPEAWRRAVAEVIVLSASDEARALGDTLPVGLTLDP
jgi:DNA-K related protein